MIEIGENLRDVLIVAMVIVAVGSFFVYILNYLNGN